MCIMQWGRPHDTLADMVILTGRCEYSRADVISALTRAYSEYHTQPATQTPEAKSRISLDTDIFFATGELPDYALAAVP